MNLLIVTQRVDRTDPILGFFHRWLQEFGKQNRVTVIGQAVGEHDLPGVTVESLGKEKGISRIAQIVRFWSLILGRSSSYDAVLVHMTPVWIVLGAPVWLMHRKRMFLWYEARGGGIWLKIAARLVRKIFSASASGMPFQSSKTVVVGHGIDTDHFRPGGARQADLLITVGRITMAKRVERITDALAALPASVRLRIVGLPLTDADRAYAALLHERIRQQQCEGRIEQGALPQDRILPLLQSATVFAHASETALDKALLEAMACGCPVVSCASAVQSLLPASCRSTPDTFTDQLNAMLKRSDAERAAIGTELRAIVERDHALPRLITRLVSAMA